MPTGVPISMAAALIGCVAALYFTLAILRRWFGKERVDTRAVALCGVCWMVTLGSYVVTNDAFLVIARLTGIPNLAWLLGYIALVVCLHCVTIMVAVTMQIEQARIDRSARAAGLVIAVLVIVFFAGGIAYSPSNLSRTLPRTFSELVFIDVTQGYVAFAFVEPLRMSLRLLAGPDSSRETRMRSAVLVLVFSAGILFSVLRIGLTSATYYALPVGAALLGAVQRTSLVLFGITMLLWPLAFVPSRWVKAPLQVSQLGEVRFFLGRLEAVCGGQRMALVDIPASWWARLSKCRFYVDMVSVLVMDVKWLLRAGYLVIEDRRVLAMVNALDESLPPDNLLAQCAELSRRLRQADRLGSEASNG